MSGLEELSIERQGNELDYGGAIRVVLGAGAAPVAPAETRLDVHQLIDVDDEPLVIAITDPNKPIPYSCTKIDCPPYVLKKSDDGLDRGPRGTLTLKVGPMSTGVLAVARTGRSNASVIVLERPSQDAPLAAQLAAHRLDPKLAFHLYWVPPQAAPHPLEGKVLAIPVPQPPPRPSV